MHILILLFYTAVDRTVSAYSSSLRALYDAHYNNIIYYYIQHTCLSDRKYNTFRLYIGLCRYKTRFRFYDHRKPHRLCRVISVCPRRQHTAVLLCRGFYYNNIYVSKKATDVRLHNNNMCT